MAARERNRLVRVISFPLPTAPTIQRWPSLSLKSICKGNWRPDFDMVVESRGGDQELFFVLYLTPGALVKITEDRAGFHHINQRYFRWKRVMVDLMGKRQFHFRGRPGHHRNQPFLFGNLRLGVEFINLFLPGVRITASFAHCLQPEGFRNSQNDRLHPLQPP